MHGFVFSIDRGGTFTDLWARCPNGNTHVLKLLSEDPRNYADAPTEGIRRILEKELGIKLMRNQPINGDFIEWIRMGTTVATNALLERKGERIAVIITKGFKDVFMIGDQSRNNLFNLNIENMDILYDDIVEINERIVLKQDSCQLNTTFKTVEANTGEKLEIWEEIDMESVKELLLNIWKKGIRHLAVALVHSYLYNAHEKLVEKIAYEIGFVSVTLSSESCPMAKLVPRGSTAIVDAYLTPCLKTYISNFLKGFINLPFSKVLFMQSNGGLTHLESFTGSRAIMSGPAGGVVGYAKTTYNKETNTPVIGFDMGGTSTDVSRYAGNFEEIIENMINKIKILVPQLNIQTVAAGGGSILSLRNGMFIVGPESASAHPGPVSYRKGGPLTVTDANLILGRIIPDYFPKVFGESEDESLDVSAALTAFQSLTDQINSFNKQNGISADFSTEQVALGFINVANESMCRPIRSLTEGQGYDTSNHILSCFGGAGGQHACAMAKLLGIKTIFIHKYSGLLSAFGLALADVVVENQQPSSLCYREDSFAWIDARVDEMISKCNNELLLKGFTIENIENEVIFHMRYEGTDCALICSKGPKRYDKYSCSKDNLDTYFVEKFNQEFGFILEGRHVVVESLRIKGIGRSSIKVDYEKQENAQTLTQPETVKNILLVFFDCGYLATPLYVLSQLATQQIIDGPAVIIDQNSTILVERDCQAYVTEERDIIIKVGKVQKLSMNVSLDPIKLSIFSHRFMSIAEQMGRVLQRTAISTNIKERLDFSCALFGDDGGLVANAPHIPVHLGAMQQAVQYQMQSLGDDLKDGTVILSNHPCAGGSHLPDLTVITPVFYKDCTRPVFFVACRGHHADIGGSTPGSMPSNSTSIHEEGAVFKSFPLIKNHSFNEQELIEALNAPSTHPGCTGSRNVSDNISDLRAQVAANNKGILLVLELIEEYGLNVVQAYMNYIQSTAQYAVRNLMKNVGLKIKDSKKVLTGEDKMDGGFTVRLTVTINESNGSAIFDFSGSSYEVYGNLNAPKAVTYSAIIYCLRCMIGQEIPLNQGCLEPITVIIPDGSILNPSEEAAVVGGNVLTSQRIVDVIFKTFQVCAASQGCMNNITFGDNKMGYYETVAGGSGAGPNWHGRSGVHTHMTNTRITDVEILEKRYPVVLKTFAINEGTGGIGEFKGGDGLIREMLFRKNLILSVLTERRVFQPYGLNGGYPGKCGSNYLIRDNKMINIGGKNTVPVKPWDVFKLKTPGGGGYGQPKQH
ncbi:hypothetical protein HELRODRAFT_105203 [Helobdella robusta]|uniref:5-oxoprolinase n=1 Tax=Helobdella robusta TaxID=6412 RepID=T1EDR6_HELRO|nr:hypothetical protein HELRODRAFT_105203 [Helobdella robusta]ESO12019.1 hypothetical protein HELRODRAFT_105203 [Helobdella robusta]